MTCEVFRGRLGSCQDANADETTKLPEENRVAKALKFVQLGCLQVVRHATLRAFRNRPNTALDAILELPRDLTVLNLDEGAFWQECEIRSQRPSWRHPSGMTHDHLRPL